MLLAVFLFNVGGYYIVFWGLRYQANQQLKARLDANQYNAEETIELKIPVAIPYLLEQKEYERTQGKIEYNGEFYTLIKQRHHQDTLYVVCIKDGHEKRLVDTMNSYVKLSNDIPGANNKALNLLSKLLKDFDCKLSFDFEQYNRWSIPLIHQPAKISWTTVFEDHQSPPPRMLG